MYRLPASPAFVVFNWNSSEKYNGSGPPPTCRLSFISANSFVNDRSARRGLTKTLPVTRTTTSSRLVPCMSTDAISCFVDCGIRFFFATDVISVLLFGLPRDSNHNSQRHPCRSHRRQRSSWLRIRRIEWNPPCRRLSTRVYETDRPRAHSSGR